MSSSILQTPRYATQPSLLWWLIGFNQFADNFFKLILKPLQDEGVDFWWLDWQQGNEYACDILDTNSVEGMQHDDMSVP